MKQKGQITIEFVIALGVLVTLFAFAVWAHNERLIGLNYSKQGYNANLLADRLAGKINAVYLAGDGSEATVFLQDKGDFNIFFMGGSVNVGYGDSYASTKLLTESVSAENISLGGYANIKNSNGWIVVENA